MADWFRARPTKLLRGMAGLSDDAQLVYCKALFLIYENDGRVSAQMVRREFPNWRPKRVQRALEELLDERNAKLIGTATGDLHNDYAMHELQQLAALSTSRAEAGGKGGRVRAERERLARKIAERNRSPNLPLDLPENHVKPPLNHGSTATKQQLSGNFTDFQNDYDAEKPNKINGGGQATLKHARAIDSDSESDIDSPLVPPPISGEDLNANLDGPPGPKKPKRPIPRGWEPPTIDHMSAKVRNAVAIWEDGELDDQRTKFVEWAVATDARFVQWDRAFGNWCMKHHDQRRRSRHGKQSGFAVPNLERR